MYYAMVFFIIHAYFPNKRHEYSETATDKRNHNFNSHDINLKVLLIRWQLNPTFLQLLNVLFL